MPDDNTMDPQVLQAVAVSNLKSIAEQPAMLANLAFSNLVTNTNLAAQNAIAHQQALNELGISILGKTVNLIATLGPLEAKSAEELLTGNTIAEEIAALKAAVEALSSKA